MALEKHFAKIIMDDLDDAEMIYGYADQAKKDRDMEAAAFFMSRAKKRMSEFQEDLVHANKRMKGEVWDTYTDFAHDKAERIQHKIDKFTMQ